MTENQSNKSQSIQIKYEGWDEKTASAVRMNNKMENVKKSILSSIDTNIAFYKDNNDNARTLSNNIRILKDVDDYTTVILKCGTFPIWKNTVKKGVYDPVQILNDLKEKVNTDFFEKAIKSYIKKKAKQDDESAEEKAESSSKKSSKTSSKSSSK